MFISPIVDKLPQLSFADINSTECTKENRELFINSFMRVAIWQAKSLAHQNGMDAEDLLGAALEGLCKGVDTLPSSAPNSAHIIRYIRTYVVHYIERFRSMFTCDFNYERYGPEVESLDRTLEECDAPLYSIIPGEFPEDTISVDEINDILSILSPRDREIWRMYIGLDGLSYSPAAIANEFHLTYERVRQILAENTKKLAKRAKSFGLGCDYDEGVRKWTKNKKSARS